MAECSSTRPVKSILKRGHETRKTSETNNTSEGAGIKWDEMNILMTEHPLDKDYGHMKIEEPKTPYHYDDSVEEQSTSATVCPDTLTDKVKEVAKQERSSEKRFLSLSEDDHDSDEELTPEQRQHKEGFKQWRKKHYDEYHNVQRARMLLAAEQDEDEDDEEEEDDQPMDNAS